MSKMLIGNVNNMLKTPVQCAQVHDGNNVASIHVYADGDVFIEVNGLMIEYNLFVDAEIVPMGLRRKVKMMVFNLTGKEEYLN